ncbi:hypothetical protein, variant 2 [Phytophthora nicotianae P1976]|uniref:No apical meristem-associated C-terminal domain-containing protein n=1 Tax=Phytophthora nicotianae P1976 TaxID=1317066 RepID=A0A080Z088_PHYNI|nr:hypothetical protein, variant 1 [Phytophthora nicotianae P1976]ETO60050.1 hypothetical protein, variant 2 [Phytophthora nicotianae P1976]
MQKLNDIQDSYNKAADVERQSGEGILDEDEERTFHDKLVRICKHWDVLYPVFHDRASAKPIAPTGTCKPPVRSAIDTRSGVEDSNGHRDFDFPFGESPPSASKGSDEEGHNHNSNEVDTQPDSSTTHVARRPDDSIDVASDDCSVEAATGTSSTSTAPKRPGDSGADTVVSSKKRTTKNTSKKTAKSKRGKPLSLAQEPQKKRKRLDDVMYDSIYERALLAQKRTCIDLAQAKVQFTKDLLVLGIYSTDEVKTMVLALLDRFSSTVCITRRRLILP